MTGRLLAAWAIAAVLGLGAEYARAQPVPPPDDPCRMWACKLSGAAVRVTVPLASHPRPRVSLVVLADEPKHKGRRR